MAAMSIEAITAPRSSRNGFLDVVRATAMVRVIAPVGYSTHPSAAAAHAAGVMLAADAEALAGIAYEGRLWSSAGLSSTVDDLARWALALWDRDGSVVSAQTRDQMTTFLGPEFQYAGLGTYPFCPCWNEGGRIRGERWGHLGKTGELEYDPMERVAIAIYTNETVLDESVIVAYDELSKRLRDVVRGRELPVLGSG